MTVRLGHRQFDMFASLEPAPPPSPMIKTGWEVQPVADRGDVTANTIQRSYSAGSLSSFGKVMRPFRFRGGEWVLTGASHFRGDADFECYRVVPAARFDGPGEAQSHHNHDLHGDLRDHFGSYHGMAAKHGSADVVLIGPPVVFVFKAAVK